MKTLDLADLALVFAAVAGIAILLTLGTAAYQLGKWVGRGECVETRQRLDEVEGFCSEFRRAVDHHYAKHMKEDHGVTVDWAAIESALKDAYDQTGASTGGTQ